MRILAVLLSFILPGWGHILLGFSQRGVILFALSALTLNGALLTSVVWLHEPTRPFLFWSLILTAGIIWIYVLRDIWYIAVWRPSEKWKQYISDEINRALQAYIKRDYSQALVHLQKAHKKDRYNLDACFYLGLVYKRAKNDSKAISYFRRCLLLDRQGKWSSAIEYLYTKGKEKKE